MSRAFDDEEFIVETEVFPDTGGGGPSPPGNAYQDYSANYYVDYSGNYYTDWT
jgi:hypothetical protein